MVARQMVASNIWLPYAYDDQGPISQDWNYQFSVSKLWRWHPWLQFYVTAASFKLLGISAFSARLPFAVIGIISYWYFLNFLTRHGPKNKIFFFTAAVMMLLSVPLLLHFRQSRYYSLSLLFTLIAIDGYLDMKRRLLAVRPGVSSKYSMKYILGSVLLFHSFLPAALALQISFWIHQIRSLLTERQGDSLINTKRFAIAFSVSLLFTLPWAIWLKIGGQNLNFSPDLIKQHLFQHYSYIHKFIFPAFTLIPLISTRFSLNLLSKLANLRARLNENLVLFSIFISVSLFLYTFNHPYFFRYLVPLIPLFIYIAAWIIANSKPVWSLIPLISLLLMTVKTFPKYLTEIFHPYQTANAEIIGFLSSLDPEKYQKLAVNYDDFTFRFHTPFTVYGAQQLENLRGVAGEGTPLERPQPERGYKSRARTSERGKARQDPDQANSCPDVIIIFPDWGNDTLLREIAKTCQLENYSLPLHYAKLADDPDPTNHQFIPPPLRTLEVFLAPPSPS